MRVVIWENIRGEGYWNVHFIKESLQNQFSKIMMPQLLGELILVSDWLFDFCFFFVGIVISQLQHTQLSAQLEPWAQNGARKTSNIPPSGPFSNYRPHISTDIGQFFPPLVHKMFLTRGGKNWYFGVWPKTLRIYTCEKFSPLRGEILYLTRGE